MLFAYGQRVGVNALGKEAKSYESQTQSVHQCQSPDGGKQNILKGSTCTMRSRLLNFLFGEKVGVIVLTPGETVENVEIKEIGGEA